jgi:hypothetical protein
LKVNFEGQAGKNDRGGRERERDGKKRQNFRQKDTRVENLKEGQRETR